MVFDDDGSEILRTSRQGNDAAPVAGWSASGKLRTGRPNQQVNLQADFPNPGSYVVQFSLKDNPDSNIPIRALALITWSVEGNSVRRLVSISNGLSVQGVGQGVRVVMYDDTQPIGAVDPDGTEYDVSMQVARGSRGSDPVPPTLVMSNAADIQLNTVTPNATIEIPKNAGVKTYTVIAMLQDVNGRAVALPEGGLSVLLNQGSWTLSRQTYGQNNTGQFYPVTPGGTNLLIQINPDLVTAGNNVFATVIYGIDG
jgi:hypothetical protein